jgi:hypothetical protein
MLGHFTLGGRVTKAEDHLEFHHIIEYKDARKRAIINESLVCPACWPFFENDSWLRRDDVVVKIVRDKYTQEDCHNCARRV